MNGFEKRANLIKGKIIDTTLAMLKITGSNKIKIAEIAKAANVSQVTIYNYFGSKESLLRETLKKYIIDSLQEFVENMQGEYTFKEKIERIILQEKEYSISSLTPIMINQMLTEDNEMAQFIEKQYNEKVIPVFIQLIEDGKKNGEISEKISVEGFLMYINLSMKFSNEFLTMIKQSGNMDIINEMVHIFFYGLCGKP